MIVRDIDSDCAGALWYGKINSTALGNDRRAEGPPTSSAL
jgi:hypothetical protein